MKKNVVSMTAALGFLISFSALNRCGAPRAHDFETDGALRLIDRLGPEQVKATPFSEINIRFETVEEDLTERLRLFRELSTSRRKVWSVTTDRSILGEDEARRPGGMSVYKDEEEMAFYESEGSDRESWKWIETSRDIDMRFDENYNKGFKCIVLDVGESFSFETILPDAPCEIEVYARRNWHPLHLNMIIDEKPGDALPVGKNFDFFSFEQSVEPGTHRITLEPLLTEHLDRKRPTPPRLLIFQIKIKTANDMILFFVPSDRQKDFTSARLRTEFLTDQDEQGRINPHTSLYRVRNDFTMDEFAQPVNPENLKKKLVLENLSLDALMAPPFSRFEFELTPTAGCRLEFTTGIFSYKGQQADQAARFLIRAETENGEPQTIYDQVLRLEEAYLRDQLRFERLDLSGFAGSRIRLIFETQNPENTEVDPDRLALAFWHNPLVYQASTEGLKVILISLDTLRADHLGSYGYNRPTSPAMDALASDAVLFENTYAQSSWTLPSHMSILYGLNSASHQVYFNDQKADPALPSHATHLKNRGFLTHAFTGGGYVSSIYGFAKGFDWYDEPVGGRKAPLGLNEAENLFTLTSNWLETHHDKSFFLFLHTFQIHGPYVCPEPWNQMFLEEGAPWTRMALRNFLDKNGENYAFSKAEKANIVSLYDGEIRYTDDMLIKPLIERLKQLGIYDNTLLIITSDHGEEFQDHGGWLHGRTVYDELIRVPLLIKFPGSHMRATRVASKTRLIDILPTVMEIAGRPLKSNDVDGQSLLPLIERKENGDRIFISDLAHKDVPDPCPALIATNKGRLKFIITKSKDGVKKVETYDLERDPRERQNIFRRADKLREEVIGFLDDYYRRKLKIQRQQGRVRMDKELEEKLKALGYLR